MAFTFECGICHSEYRLDARQIPPRGAKITCPKCMSFFILTPGGRGGDSPVIENLVAEQPAIPKDKEDTFPKQILKEEDLGLSPSKPQSPPKTQAPPPSTSELSCAPIQACELTDLPSDEPEKESSAEQYMLLSALIVIVIAGLLLLNYSGVIAIPGLGALRSRAVSERGMDPSPAVTPEPEQTPQYGFPEFDAGYDPWKEEAEKAPPADQSP